MGTIVDAIEKFLSVPDKEKPQYMIDATPRFEADATDGVSDIDPIKPAEPQQLASVQELLTEIEHNTRSEVDKPHITFDTFFLPAGQIVIELPLSQHVNRITGFTMPVIGTGSAEQAFYALWVRRPYTYMLTSSQTQMTGKSAPSAQQMPLSFTYPEILELPYPANHLELYLNAAFTENVTIIIEGFYKK